MKRYRNKTIVSGLVILILLNFFAWQAALDLNRQRYLEINFFDVGQGDAVLVQTPQKQQILIDGGPDSTIVAKLSKAMPFWDRSIDLIILSHPEKDHFAGLLEVLKRYKVENVLWTGIVRETPEYITWRELIQKEGAEIFIAKAGQRITVSKAEVDILYPFENLEGKNFKNSNDTSVVVRLIFGENSFLFTGDASVKIEKELAKNNELIDSNVLKVGHHGSKTSTSPDFLGKVSPEIAVISAGRGNSYGHPHKEVLENLAKYGIDILRTDERGDIKIISDGIQYKIQ